MASFKEMTANEILNLGDEELGRMSQRELSHALRTISLVANKRINRLQKNVEKDPYSIAQDALKNVTESGGRFGVGTKNRNQMQKEMARARQFMRMKTSTVKGARETRKKRETKLYGKTHEQEIKEEKKKAKKENKEYSKYQENKTKEKYFKQMASLIVAFEKFKEAYPYLASHFPSEEIKQILYSYIERGYSVDESVEATAKDLISRYEKEQDEFNRQTRGEYFSF